MLGSGLLWMGVLLLVAGCYLYKADFAQYSIFTIGVFKRVYRFEWHSEPCSVDGCTDSSVELREATKEIVLFGCPVLRHGSVTNAYCDDHASFEYREGLYHKPTTKQVRESIEQAALSFVEWQITPPDEQDPFEKTVRTTNGALSLLPVVVLVLTVAVCVGWAKQLRA